ncbi:lytic transglycosylase domain-containing protein [Jannaschia sp. W003]|uniref:lytic transglycosylase domain-containing protein n=1 Tax=Jannaschia sp. W003 TaxID=2867012 RepID=UPI0021A63D4B|nr:lytic transglycosylase domain-containing protein [Jannaschia sp. W003]UWQ22923.1 lytic transglycosylase domain-containing protein [Jannaschia sp. W003]
MKHIISLALAGALLVPLAPAPASAEFTFKRVRPPAAGSTARRITIQIAPPTARAVQAATAAAAAARAAAATAAAIEAGAGDLRAPRPAKPDAPGAVALRTSPAVATAAGSQSWFWSAVSPDIAPAPGRFTAATRVAARPPAASGVRAPRLETLRRIVSRHGGDILRHSAGKRVSPALVLALISVESAGRVDAVSHAGARGLMQLIPDTAKRFGVRDITDPGENIRGGVAYLDWLVGEFGDPVLALAGYNAGEGAVRRHKGVPPYKETRAYVPKVMAAWSVARSLCITPPVMPGDGCVFHTELASR